MMLKKLWKESPFCHLRTNYPLDMIVVHHIGSKAGKLYGVGGTITWFINEEVHRNKATGKIENKVSAHYIVPRSSYKGHDVIHLVKECNVAYHAGRSQWEIGGTPRKNINNYSIGIELEGDGNLCEYTDFQYDTLIALCKELIDTYNIPQENIVGHEDISPGRKVDPGKLFDWKRLNEGISPPPIVMPDVHVSPLDPPLDLSDTRIPDSDFSMSGGIDEKESIFQMIINLFLKRFK